MSEEPPGEQVGYAAWGEAFFRTAVTPERLLGAVGTLAGRPLDVGPLAAGPGGLARIRATGRTGEPWCAGTEQADEGLLTHRIVVPVVVDFSVEVALDTHRFHADLEVPLLLTARPLSGVRLLVDVTPPRTRDVVVRVRGEGLRASLLQRVGNVEGELRRFVARFVAREIERPEVARARLIDVAGAIDAAWQGFAPR